MRFGVYLGPFWVSFGGSRRRERVRGQVARALSPAGVVRPAARATAAGPGGWR